MFFKKKDTIELTEKEKEAIEKERKKSELLRKLQYNTEQRMVLLKESRDMQKELESLS